MIRFTVLFLFIISVTCFAQKNSTPYLNTKLIKIHSADYALADSLLQRKAIPISCRGSILQSNVIVHNTTINWLNKHHIPFSVINDDVQAMIDLEMEKININRFVRSSSWYSTYKELNEIESRIDSIVLDVDFMEKINIGQSYEGRDMSVIKISRNNDFIEDKPAILINGCQHAREWITPMVTTYLIEQLANIDSNSSLDMFLNFVDIHIVPVVNPDGYVYTWEKDRWWRKNRQINVGSDCVGTDLNRNWDFDWNGEQSTSEDPCSFIYVGESPFSAPETYFLSEYITSIPNLVGHIDVHNYSALIVGPWASSTLPTDDNNEIFCLGTNMQSAISNTHNYPYIFGTGTVNDLLYLISGGMVDWVYDSYPALSFLYEMRPASLYYFDSSFDGLSAFDNDQAEILPTCQEFYQGVIEMIKWAYFDNCELATGCSDPSAENYYCNTPEGNMGCLYNVDLDTPPQNNGAYNLVSYGLPLGFIDDGSCEYSTYISPSNKINNVVKIVDVLGRKKTSKGLFIEMYDDGTVVKKYIN
tara:strand:+ start:68 stop:1657 length:1590 start_codon:yes stop_codon:yes gene_type:complete